MPDGLWVTSSGCGGVLSWFDDAGHILFAAPLSYGDTAVVELRVAKIGRSSVTFHYDIRRKRDGVHCFKAEITTVLVNLDTLAPVPLDAELKGILEKFLSST